MKRINVMRRGFAFLGAVLVGLGLLASGMTVAAEDAVARATRFAQLDAAAEQVLNEVTALGGEMAALEASHASSLNPRLLVLVTIDALPSFQLGGITLKIDGNTISDHQYAAAELAALQQGGSHRLFQGSLPSGRHQLTVTMTARAAKDSDFRHESTLAITAGGERKVVELRVSSDKKQPLPEVSLKEWK